MNKVSSIIEELNKKLKAEYDNYGGLELFAKYVMSETIAPIEDYENVVKIIRENYHKQINAELLIIGAYSTIFWTRSDSEMLEILNLMRPFLPEREKAIVHYLNAYKLYMIDDDYLSKQEYKAELYASLISNVPFVNNRLRIAELLTEKEAEKYYAEALNNVQEIFSKEIAAGISLEYSLNPQSFINEFILGTHITKDRYDEIAVKGNVL